MSRLVVTTLIAACGRVGFDGAPDGLAESTDAPAMLAYRDAVLADRPLGYWRLGDAGTTVHDETGTLDATSVGACPAVTGALDDDPNAATKFDGGCRFSLGTGFHFEGTAAFSIEVWIDSPQSPTQTQYTVMNERRTMDDANPINGYAIVISPTGGLYAERAVATSLRQPIFGTQPTGFTHVVFTYDGSEVQLFVDAVGGAPIADARAIPAYTTELDIGGIPTQAGASALGSLDELAVYDHALSQDRITLHHDLGIHGPRSL